MCVCVCVWVGGWVGGWVWVRVCVCLYSSTVEASSVCNVLYIFESTGQRSCFMGIILDVQISFILVSESIKLHLQRRNSGVAMNQKTIYMVPSEPTCDKKIVKIRKPL